MHLTVRTSTGGLLGWLAVMLLAALPACDRRRPLGAREVRLAIALVGTRSDDPTWQAVRAGAARFSNEVTELDLKEILPRSATPVAQEVALQALGRREPPQAVCVLAIHADALVQPINKLRASNVHVVLIGDDALQARRHLYVGVDEQAVGAAIGKALAAACKPRRTMMVVHDNRGDRRSVLRHKGLTREWTGSAGVRVLREFDCLGKREQALKFLYETSERYPNLGGWALIGDWLRDDLPADRPLTHGAAKIVSCGAHPGGFHLLEAGRVDALVGVDWEDLGYRALQACYQLLSLSAVPTRDYHAPPIVVTRENLPAHRKKWRDIIPAPSSRPASR